MSKDCEILNRFLEEIHEEKCVFKVSKEVVNDLKEAVEELVRKFVHKVSFATAYPLFSGSKILSRGSFYEGTKVEEPNEFDFLVELDVLSQPGRVGFRSECLDCPGYTHVLFTDPELQRMNAELESSPKDNFLRPYTISSYYRRCLEEAYRKLFTGSWCRPDDVRIDKGCGFLRLQEHISTNWGPNTLVKLVWTTKTLPDDNILKCIVLTVDITPAIVYRPPECNPDSAGADKHCHVVPARNDICKHGSSTICCCWRISHSSEETEKMRSLSDVHKKIYKIFKVVCRKRIIDGPLRSLTSYMLKTAVLHHTETCDSNSSIGACTMKILEELLTFAQQEYLPDYFIPEQNVWAKQNENDVVSPVPIIEKLILEFKSIAGCAVEDYDFGQLFKYFDMLKEELAMIEANLFSASHSTLPDLAEVNPADDTNSG
ncbi:cyclic GMP-AMP synthase-like receptor [Liolophura sinensis]|uniref:cyclic GMP-AMP synthase-like receptor n=1 Tax=Liolophura sinensis TaxID=3198878 RepID=UPI0031583390